MTDYEPAADREDEIRLEMTRCRHFTGIQHDKCEAEINYRQLVGGDDFGWALAIPCLGGNGRKPKDRSMVSCASYSVVTREEAEKIVDESRAHVTDVLRRIAAGEDVPGVIVCGGRTQPDEKECPQSVDGKCSKCGADVESIYGIGSGYGGIGGYSFCTNEDCGEIHDFVEDTGE